MNNNPIIAIAFYTLIMLLILAGLKSGLFSGHKNEYGLIEKGISVFVIAGWLVMVLAVMK